MTAHAPFALLCLAAAVKGLYYDLPTGQSYNANGQTNNFTAGTVSGICFCDFTIGACDPDCDCDAECTQNHDELRSIYNFDYTGNSINIQSSCYHKESDHIFKVNANRVGIKKVSENDTFVCVEVTDTNVDSSIIAPDFNVPANLTIIDSPTTLASQLTTEPERTAGYQMADILYMESNLRSVG